MIAVKKWIPILLIVIGVVAIVVALGADLLNMGKLPGFGVQQTIVAIVGVFLAMLGFVFRARWGKISSSK